MRPLLPLLLCALIASTLARLGSFPLIFQSRIPPNKKLVEKYSSIFRETAHQLALSPSNSKLTQGNLEHIRSIMALMVNFVIAFNTFDVVYSLVGSNIDATALITPQLPFNSE